ncbi:MAG: hypothetical protein K2H23_08915, partial [Oscillospiraceae bacterium]|nr:hypothetical protein [Oscillospiraceae bacterium]
TQIHSIVFLVPELLIKTPFQVGLFGFLFGRLAGENPRIASVFDFYRGARKIFKAFVASHLFLMFASILSALFLTLMNVSSSGGMIAGILYVIIILCVGLIFDLAPYIYAEAPDSDIGDIVIKSVRLGIKYFYIILAANALMGVLGVVYFLLLPRKDFSHGSLTDYLAMIDVSNNIFVTVGGLIFSAVTMWISFTAAYIILEKAKSTAENAVTDIDDTDEYSDEMENDGCEPFIKPYDFFIEADERFSDEKIIETEDIRGIDIIAVFESMELADDIKVNHSIRKKLKRMFDDLSFEIGEFVTYQGGRSIGNDFTEEIDDREFEISVDISKNSDYEPFKLILRVNISDYEE